MKQLWDRNDLEERFTLTETEMDLLPGRSSVNTLGFSILLKYLQNEGHFPEKKSRIPKMIILFMAEQLSLDPGDFERFRWNGREHKRQKAEIRKFCGYIKWSQSYYEELVSWLIANIPLEKHRHFNFVDELSLKRLKELKVEPPKERTLERIIFSSFKKKEEEIFSKIASNISNESKEKIDQLIEKRSMNKGFGLQDLKDDYVNLSIKSISKEIEKLTCIENLKINCQTFKNYPSTFLKYYRDRVANEDISELRDHPESIRYTLIAIYVHQRRFEIVDSLLDLLTGTVHKIKVKGEKKVNAEIINEAKNVRGKNQILYKMSITALLDPDEAIRKAIFPVVTEKTMQAIIKEYESGEESYLSKTHTQMRGSYSHHYRKMLIKIIQSLEFHSNNELYKPIIEAIDLIQKYCNSHIILYPQGEQIPIEGIIPPSLIHKVFDKKSGRVKRMEYELCILESLRDKLRCKEVWVKHANRYQNPDDDLPKDFNEKRKSYYEKLGLPEDADEYIFNIKSELEKNLLKLNTGLPSNKYVKIRKSGTIKLTALEAQEDPFMISKMKSEIFKKWDVIPLLDALKETDLYTGFYKFFETSAQRQILSEEVLRKRLLLSIYGLATNTGLKSVSFGNGEKYDDLLYISRRFINSESLRQAISHLVEQTFKIRQEHIWGNATVSCASDSKQFPAWDQNIMTEYHQRYGGRGIMIYWHVDKNSCCIYSHIKSCSSSESSSMIQGVLNHETSMNVEKQYVDTHGQSFVAFSFCDLLGFDLLPRFRSVKDKKLFLPSLEIKGELGNLEGVLTRPINWDLIKQHYDEMVRFTTALKLGTASAESILRRFTRNNIKHPTYQALIELGKALRTSFLCKYLSSKELRQEIHEGLNIVEQWNGVNEFIFFGKGREFSSNSKKQQEISALSLHLLQNSLVYLNTLMIQDILEDPVLFNQFDRRDFKALNPLFHAHINPYGTFDLDFSNRLNLSVNDHLKEAS